MCPATTAINIVPSLTLRSLVCLRTNPQDTTMDISFLLNDPEADPSTSSAGQSTPQPSATNGVSAVQHRGDSHDVAGTPFPPLPPSPVFDTCNELFAFLHDFHINNGAAIVRASSGTKRNVDGILQPTWIKFKCDRGPQRESQSAGLRKTSTQKMDCPFTITASATKASH